MSSCFGSSEGEQQTDDSSNTPPECECKCEEEAKKELSEPKKEEERISSLSEIITPKKVAKDLKGKKVGNWTFDKKTKIKAKVLEIKPIDDHEASVIADVSVTKKQGNYIVTVYEGNGKMRLTYEKITGDWFITSVEPLSFKVGNRTAKGKKPSVRRRR